MGTAPEDWDQSEVRDRFRRLWKDRTRMCFVAGITESEEFSLYSLLTRITSRPVERVPYGEEQCLDADQRGGFLVTWSIDLAAMDWVPQFSERFVFTDIQNPSVVGGWVPYIFPETFVGLGRSLTREIAAFDS